MSSRARTPDVTADSDSDSDSARSCGSGYVHDAPSRSQFAVRTSHHLRAICDLDRSERLNLVVSISFVSSNFSNEWEQNRDYWLRISDDERSMMHSFSIKIQKGCDALLLPAASRYFPDAIIFITVHYWFITRFCYSASSRRMIF